MKNYNFIDKILRIILFIAIWSVFYIICYAILEPKIFFSVAMAILSFIVSLLLFYYKPFAKWFFKPFFKQNKLN